VISHTERAGNGNIANPAQPAYIAPAFSTSVTLQRLVPPGAGGKRTCVQGALMADIDLLTRIIEPEAQALGFDLVRVKMIGGSSDPTLQVMAERPDTRQLTIDDCGKLSHRISDKLDDLEAAGRDPIEGTYRLEVSSPGIDRPLTRLKDYADWAGHEARLKLVEPMDGRKQLTGVLTGVEDGRIVIDVK
jgi:ribosome maturation factor RimP